MKKAFIAAGLIMAMIACKEQSLTPTEDVNNHSNAKAEASITAQSIMIDAAGKTEAILVGNEVWLFDENAAAAADPTYTSCNPATTGPGNGNSCRAAALTAIRAAKCTYWNTEGHPYWVLQNSNTSGSPDINLDLTIAGESFMKGGVFKTLGKYSFTMGTADAPRVSSISWSLDGVPMGSVPATLQDATVDNGCLLGLIYNGNAGTFGNLTAQGSLKTGMSIGDILASDDDKKNDVGCGTVTIAKSALNFSLGENSAGDHDVTITATVKGNGGVADVTVSKSFTIHVAAQGCQD